MPASPLFLDADAAARTLGIQRASLYAYVSRGLIQSEADPSDTRKRRYSASDVARLARRKAQRARPERAASEALHWGAPVLDSAITRIEAGQCHYRGREVAELARAQDFESVARLLWLGGLSADSKNDPFSNTGTEGALGLNLGFIPDSLPMAERMICVLALASAEDLSAWNLDPVQMPRIGARITRLLTEVVESAASPEVSTRKMERRRASEGEEVGGEGEVLEKEKDAEGSRSMSVDANQPIAARLAGAWGVSNPEARRLIDAALILSADQELNVSSFTVRCVTSAGSTAYAAVQAGLAALQGVRHGGHSARVWALMREAGNQEGVRPALRERLQQGETIPGFGHPLYPDGDPRCNCLLEMLRQAAPHSPELALSETLAAEGLAHTGRQPTIDLALVALARVLGLPREAPFALFAIGRSAGWIAHAIEQAQDGRIIRPRARYVGQVP
jgi:citrate synthase